MQAGRGFILFSIGKPTASKVLIELSISQCLFPIMEWSIKIALFNLPKKLPFTNEKPQKKEAALQACLLFKTGISESYSLSLLLLWSLLLLLPLLFPLSAGFGAAERL